MIVQQYNPTLSDLLNVDSLPSNLGFLQAPLSSFLDNFFYQNLRSFKRKDGATASYTLDIITYQPLTLLEIPGTGIMFVLNPPNPSSGQGSSLFNVSFEYKWEILKYIENANIQSFGFDLKSYLNLLSSVFNISQHDFLKETINVFLGNIDNPPPGIDPLQLFVNNYNSSHTNQLTYTPPPNDAQYDNIYNQLVGFSQDIFDLIVTTYLPNGFSDFRSLLSSFIGPSGQDSLGNLLIPQFSISINNIGFGITFPTNFLTPINSPNPPQSILYVNAGSFLYDSQRGFQFDENLSFSFTPSYILNTGFTLAITDAQINLSNNYGIPEVGVEAQNGSPLPNGFMGVYVQQITIGLPQYLIPTSGPGNAQIVGTNLLIGTGGITGTLTLDTTSGPVLQTNLGSSSGFSLALDSVSVTFQQSAITASDITGVITIPGFNMGTGPANIAVDIHFGADGSFNVTASPTSPITITIPGVLDFNINSLEVGENSAHEWFVALSGSLDFIATIPALSGILPTGIDIKKLIVYEDGRFEFEGGTIILPKPITLSVGPVSLSISALSFGSWENAMGRKYQFFGFDGGINVNPGGVDVRANGVKFYYSTTPTLDVFIRIEGIAIDIIIPGDATPAAAALLLHGFLSMKNPSSSGAPTGTQYVGGVNVSIPKAGIAGTANMALNPNLPSFLIDMDLEISVPIPIVPGLGIYGFRGLIGQRYVADKSNPLLGIPPDADWYQYYKLKMSPDYAEGIQVEKMEQEDGFSIGAGLSLATTGDSGKSFSSKLFVLLSCPDVFLIQGQAAILRQRIGLDTTQDPPFSLFVAITDQYVQASIGASYMLPEDGDHPGGIATINGEIDMSFPFHSNGWYINFGQDTPSSKRILVRLLNIFDAYFYLMINAQRIRAGAGVSYSNNQNFGPVSLYLTAYLDVAGQISFEPKQIGGSIDLGGTAGIKVFTFKLGLSLAAGLAGESAKPFDVTGSVSVTISLPWPFKNIGITLSFTWTFDPHLNTSEVKVIDLTAPTAKQPARSLNIMSNDTYSLYYNTDTTGALPPQPTDAFWGGDTGNGGRVLSQGGYTIPIDSFIDFEFIKGMLPKPSSTAATNFGGVTMGADYLELVGPQQAASPIVQHSFIVNDISIYYWDPGANNWLPYNIYTALTPQQDLLSLPPSAFAGLFYGFWQLGEPNKYSKLKVLSQTPFTYLINQAGNQIAPESMGLDTSSIGCAEELIQPTCINFDGQAGGTANPPYQLTAGKTSFYKNVLLHSETKNAVVVAHSGFSHADSLEIAPGDTLEIYFIKTTAQACLSLSTTNRIVVKSYQKVQTGVNSSNLPIYTYNLVDTKSLSASQLSNPVCYQSTGVPIDKITVTAVQCGGQGTPAASNQGFNCTENTPQARQLLIFLTALAHNGDLTKSGFFLDNPNYVNIFTHTVLYNPKTPHDIDYKSKITNGVLNVTITAGPAYSCSFSLQPLTPTQVINYSAITSFQNLRLNPSDITAGNNYAFLVDAIINGKPVTLEGTSCYPIASCVYNCGTFLYQICSLSLVDALYNQSVPSQASVTNSNTMMAKAINNTLQPIWRPNTIYAIQVSTTDQVIVPGNTPMTYNNFFNIGFQTAGPVGFFQQSRIEYADLVSQDLADQFRLAFLKDYIDYTKSYPNADGNVLQAKPLFYQNPQLLLFFVENYVYAMFSNWGSYGSLPPINDCFMQITIKDPVENLSPGAGAEVSYNFSLPTTGGGGSFNLSLFLSNGNHYNMFGIPGGANLAATVANFAAAITLNTPFIGSSVDQHPPFGSAAILIVTTQPGTAYNGVIMAISVSGSFFLPIINPTQVFAGGQNPQPTPEVSLTISDWKTNTSPTVPKDVTILSNMLQNGKPCSGVGALTPMGVNAVADLSSLSLKPLKLYNAIVYNNFNNQTKQEVHRYNFQTSEYANFTEQIQSYVLDSANSVYAIFDVDKAFPATSITSAQQIVNGTEAPDDILIQEFADEFDRILDGALQVGAIAPAQGTDFNIIRDTNTGNILGILIRNPEPFNDPKLPPSVLAQTLTVTLNSFVTAFDVIFSKDRAKAFITNSGPNSLNMLTGSYVFTFQYILFNGVAYAPIDTEIVQFTIS